MLERNSYNLIHADLMPEVEPFSTRGKIGSGFPFCIPSVDVSDYYLVAPMTLEQFSHIFWNSFALRATAISDVVSLTDVEFDGSKLPKTRVCGGVTADKFEQDPDGGYYAAILQLTTNWTGIKMYDGAITEEANFIGYGINSYALDGTPSGKFFALAGAHEDGGSGRYPINRFLVSYCRYDPSVEYPYGDEIEWFQEYSLLANDSCTATATVVGGIPFVALNWDAPVYGDRILSAEITDIEFYTYP